MVEVVSAGIKRKKPPTFQHIPIQRAKKLKQSWVKNQKIKTQWKATKIKKGLATPAVVANGEGEMHCEEEEEEEEEEERPQVNSTTAPAASKIHPSRHQLHGIKEERKSTESNSVHPARAGRKGKGKESDDLSLRELAREAYSPTSLHTFKSDPLKKRGGPANGGTPGRGRGQPNMKLRMGLMLEKIKRDFA